MIRSVVLFAHIVGMLLLFIGLALEWISLESLRKSSVPGTGSRWVSVLRAVPRLAGPAVGLILVSGIYLAARVGVFDQAWVRVSFASMVLMGVLGGPVVRSRMRALQHAASDDRDETAATLRRYASHPLLHASLRTRVVVGLTIIYLMIGKPAFVESLVLIAIALALGAAISLPQWRAHSSLTLLPNGRGRG